MKHIPIQEPSSGNLLGCLIVQNTTAKCLRGCKCKKDQRPYCKSLAEQVSACINSTSNAFCYPFHQANSHLVTNICRSRPPQDANSGQSDKVHRQPSPTTHCSKRTKRLRDGRVSISQGVPYARSAPPCPRSWYMKQANRQTQRQSKKRSI